MPAFGEVHADPQRVLQGAQRERPPGAGGVEEAREGGAVQQGDTVGEGRSGVGVGPVLAFPRVELAEHLGLAGGLQRAAQGGEGGGYAIEEFAQLGHGGEAAVRGPERPEELGEGGGGPAYVDPGDVPHEALGEEHRGLVGVGGAAVEVQVVDGVGVADAHDDVVGPVGPEGGAGGGDRDDGGLPGQGLQRERLHDRAHQPGGLAGAGGADGEQGGAEDRGVEGDAAAAAGVRVALAVLDRAEQHLPGEQIVPGGADGKVARSGRVDARPGAHVPHGVVEGPRP